MPEQRSAYLWCHACKRRFSLDATRCPSCRGPLTRRRLDEPADPRRMHTTDPREHGPQ